MSTTPSAILLKAVDYLNLGWIQNTYAQNRYGQRTRVDNENACGFCASGAILAAAIELGETVTFDERYEPDNLGEESPGHTALELVAKAVNPEGYRLRKRIKYSWLSSMELIGLIAEKNDSKAMAEQGQTYFQTLFTRLAERGDRQ